MRGERSVETFAISGGLHAALLDEKFSWSLSVVQECMGIVCVGWEGRRARDNGWKIEEELCHRSNTSFHFGPLRIYHVNIAN